MRRVWFIGFVLLLLSACSAHEPEKFTDAEHETVVAEPELHHVAHVVDEAETCVEPDDGIGGTGCPVD